MKKETDKIDLMDALLKEHATRGAAADQEMVNAILAETVFKQTELPQPSERPAFGAANWMKVAALVTLLLGFSALILMQFKGESKREETTFQLAVTYLSSSEVADSVNPNAKPVSIRPGATIDLVELDSNVNRTREVSADWIESFSISADETVRTPGKLEYSGDVEVTHPTFTIQADRLVVSKENALTENGAFRAFGAVVERTLENGEVEIARGDQLVYEPAARSLVLFGKNLHMKAGNREFSIENSDASGEMLVLRPDGFQIVRL